IGLGLEGLDGVDDFLSGLHLPGLTLVSLSGSLCGLQSRIKVLPVRNPARCLRGARRGLCGRLGRAYDHAVNVPGIPDQGQAPLNVNVSDTDQVEVPDPAKVSRPAPATANTDRNMPEPVAAARPPDQSTTRDRVRISGLYTMLGLSPVSGSRRRAVRRNTVHSAGSVLTPTPTNTRTKLRLILSPSNSLINTTNH